MATRQCPYYFERPQYGRGTRAGEKVLIAYCQHKHAPVTRLDTLAGNRKAPVLCCGGDLRKCEIPPELRLDTEA